MRSETVPGGSATICVVVAPEQTANAGSKAIHAQRRAVDFASSILYFTGTPFAERCGDFGPSYGQ
jgi:hypothetical protein